MIEGPDQAEALLLFARVCSWDRWSWRAVVALVPATGAAVLLAAVPYAGDVPLSLWFLGAAMLILGAWSETTVWRAGGESLRIALDGSLLVHGPTLLARDLVVPSANVGSVRLSDGLNVPRNAAVLTFFTRGDYLRIDLVDPVRMRDARYSNYVWSLRESRDPWPVPLPHRTVRSLGFIMDRAEAERALRLLAD